MDIPSTKRDNKESSGIYVGQWIQQHQKNGTKRLNHKIHNMTYT